jgi:glycosyltransferase involved in cell wall biosynthesis
MESALAGTIPIASKVGGVPEIVEGTFAENMLFEPGNVDECVDKIESLLSMSNEKIEDVGSDLKESVYEKFGSEVVMGKLVKAFST